MTQIGATRQVYCALLGTRENQIGSRQEHGRNSPEVPVIDTLQQPVIRCEPIHELAGGVQFENALAEIGNPIVAPVTGGHVDIAS